MLNLIFVILLRMNVTGVAAATVISTALSAGTVLFLLVRESSYLRPAFSCPDKENIREIVCIGLPAALQGAVFCFANIFIQAATTFISQNYAAHNYSRCKKALAVCTLMSFIACAALTVPQTFPQNLQSIPRISNSIHRLYNNRYADHRVDR